MVDQPRTQVNARYPYFKHRRRKEAFWLNSNLNPPWVEKGLAAMALGTVQLNIFSWNTRLTRRTKAGERKRTMELFQKMQKEGRIPDKFTFVSVLTACASLRALEEADASVHRSFKGAVSLMSM
jgi:pentatricopeptide repeat protein